MQLQRTDIRPAGGRPSLAVLAWLVVALAGLSACQDRSAPVERPTVAVLAFEAQDAHEETRDLADHLSKRLRTILATRPEIRVTESGSAMHASLGGLEISEIAGTLGADYLLAGGLSHDHGRLRLSLRLLDGNGDRIWEETFESPLAMQAQLQDWVLDKLWPQLPLAPAALEAAKSLVDDCHYPDDAMAILTLARTGRRGGDPASLAMVATADIETGLLHLAQSEFYFRQIDSLPASQQQVVEQLALRSLGRAAAACPEHPQVELLRLLYTNELALDVDNAAEYLARHPNSAALYLAVAELHEQAGSHRKARAKARESALLDPLGGDTQCRARALLESPDKGQADCP